MSSAAEHPVSRYLLTEYSPTWVDDFSCEAEQLRRLLGSLLVDVHHIGSTSVPGLAAKPTIDVLPVVTCIESVDGMAGRLEAAGYRTWGEYGLPGRRLFTRDQSGFRTHNVHIYARGHDDIERHLAFGAYLRAHPEARREYEMLKRQVYAQHPANIALYSDGKNAWIKRAEVLALSWYRTSLPQPSANRCQ